MNKSTIIILLILLSSCTKEIAIDLDRHESKIVVNSFFSPQNPLSVNISKSIPILDSDTLNYIDNARVELYHDELLIGALSYTHNGFYTMPNTLEANGVYSVSVSAPGMETVTSSDTIPPQVPIISLDTITYDNAYLYFELTFQDSAGATAYYLLDVTSKNPILNSDSVYSNQVELFVTDYIVENCGVGDACQQMYFSDGRIKGEEYSISFLLVKEYLENSINGGVNTLYINFKSISVEYSKYLRSYYSSRTQQMDVYNNIDKGYGIFAGYNVSRDSVVVQ